MDPKSINFHPFLHFLQDLLTARQDNAIRLISAIRDEKVAYINTHIYMYCDYNPTLTKGLSCNPGEDSVRTASSLGYFWVWFIWLMFSEPDNQTGHHILELLRPMVGK